jgi:hypothetical protein
VKILVTNAGRSDPFCLILIFAHRGVLSL